MPDLISHEVVENAMAGNAVAFKTIVEQHQAFAYAVAYRFVGNEEEAKDIVQEAFVRLWKNLHSYRKDVKLSTWLYRIIANLCLDFLKSRRSKEKHNRVDISRGHFSPDDSTPEKIIQQQELMRVIHIAAEVLTPKQKAVFVLRDLEGLSTEEVKEILSMSEGNIKSNLFHARQKVAEKLKIVYQASDKSGVV
ncbi:sigma-70 family RNA polymerase sigma factor [soil metagenome]